MENNYFYKIYEDSKGLLIETNNPNCTLKNLDYKSIKSAGGNGKVYKIKYNKDLK